MMFKFGKINQSLTVLTLISLISAISCTKPNFNPEKIFKEHNREELEFFIDVGFRGFIKSSIKKQTENIEVSVIGTQQESDIMLIDTIISELKPLIFPINIARIEKRGNLLIYLTPNYKGVIPKADGMTYYYHDKTAFWISPNISGRRREFVFRHEFLHALGLSHAGMVHKIFPTNVMTDRVYYEFNNNSEQFEPVNYFSDLDKAAIQILYDKEIPNGLSKKSFINLYEKFKNNDLNQQRK
jgi:hypothetical protein